MTGMNSMSTNTDTFDKVESGVRSYCRRFPVVFGRATGAWLHDSDDNKYLDFLAGCSSLNYGHNDPDIKAALADYITNDGLTHGLDMFSGAKASFLEAFDEIVLKPRDLDYVVQFPGPTGTNAVEAALKLARKVTGRHNIISFTNGFHGCTMGALAATGNQHHRGGAGAPLSGVTRMPYDGYMGPNMDTLDYMETMLDDSSSGIDAPAAVIVESVQGEGGLNAASFEWLRRLAAITRKHGALFIVDDIQAGIGRTDGFFSFETAGLKPDIVTMAKSLSGYGLPMSLVLINREYDQWGPAEHNGTFRGNCHAFVTATAALEKFWRDGSFEKDVRAKGQILQTRLKEIIASHQGSFLRMKGRGMMCGIDMGSGELAGEVVEKAFKHGMIIETSGPNDEVVKCLAPLTISEEDLNKGLDILAECVAETLSENQREAA